MKPAVFIHTNHKQMVGPVVGRHNHVPHDALAVMDRTAPLDAVLGDIRKTA